MARDDCQNPSRSASFSKPQSASSGVNRTPSHSVFSRTFVQSPSAHVKTFSATCHHVSDCALSLHPVISSSLSGVSASCPISSSLLSCSPSSVWLELPSNISPVHPQNEEYGPVVIHKSHRLNLPRVMGRRRSIPMIL